jgi:topoisomerase-4 subunit B
VGIKAVNALSTEFFIRSVRDGQSKSVSYSRGEIIEESRLESTDDPDGTLVRFTPDVSIFRDFQFQEKYIVPLVKNYTYLNTGLAIVFKTKGIN